MHMIIQFRFDNRTLWKIDAIELVVCSVGDCVAWCAHGLLAHLTLIHVTWGLIEFGKRCQVGHNAHERIRIDFLMGRCLFK